MFLTKSNNRIPDLRISNGATNTSVNPDGLDLSKAKLRIGTYPHPSADGHLKPYEAVVLNCKLNKPKMNKPKTIVGLGST